MIKLQDGPAKGSYMVKRAPAFLRAVVDPDGKRDVLDQLDDEPRGVERVHVYERIGDAGHVHINMGRKGSGFYALAEYKHIPIDGELLRDVAEWRAWCVIESNTRRHQESLPSAENIQHARSWQQDLP